ncbi:tyramine beta hydroxylase [Elysia marginata]|uniref:Tyramine beta hydroxylase n=1 Tax=Elysia marginata TaxID=1093978 RepID=A0AAV4H9M3_9GAST|nr:tyramine beta hydroxylase [Elysia marginata]
MVYPEEAGVPVGGNGFSRYVLLEIHYNNPNKRSGVVDTSGIRFYVTSQLRQFEAGIMELGLEYTNKMAVPPGQARFSLSGYCVSECTEQGLPPQGIRVFASQLHTHLTGRRVVTRHVTYTGSHVTELPELNRDDHYSSHFQEIRRLEPPVAVMPGDALITTCDYDTRNRTSATVGGFSISDEMCVNYIHYYPKTDLEVCKSSVETESLDTFLFFMNRSQDYDDDDDGGDDDGGDDDDDDDDDGGGGGGGGKMMLLVVGIIIMIMAVVLMVILGGFAVGPDLGYRASYTNIDWTPATTALLDQLYVTSPLAMQCNASDGGRLPGDWSHTPIPDLPRSSSGPSTQSETRGC